MNGGVRPNLVILGASAGAAGGAWAVTGDDSLLDLLFGTVICFGLLTAGRLVRRAVVEARAARRDAARVLATDPGLAVAAALAEERVRLAADIEAVVRESVTTMLHEAEAARERWAGDPAPQLRRIAARGQDATHELRRMLGLMRQAGEAPPPVQGPGGRRGVPRGDVVLAAGVAALALVERFVYGPLGAPMGTAGSLVLTAVAASCVLGWRVRPDLGALACGLVFLVAAARGTPVSSGFWVLATCGGLTWACAARRDLPGALGLLTLGGGYLTAEAWWDRGNLAVSTALVAVAATGGLLVGQAAVRRRAARRLTDEHRGRLDAAREEALGAERLTVARELHDLVSHAVSVMVMQAGAAQVLHPRDPDAARRSLDLVTGTGLEALGELDRLVVAIRAGALGPAPPGAGAVGLAADDLAAVVDRVRSAGLDVDLRVDGEVPRDLGPLVFRVVQEALTNTLRHASARTATIHIRADERSVEVTVRDDGSGPSERSGGGFGLVGISERVQRSGGRLTATTGSSGHGFVLHAWVPVTAVPA